VSEVQSSSPGGDEPRGARAAEPVHGFPPGFFWGTATSAHQVEGGNRHNDWWRFEHGKGAIVDGEVSGEAADHFHRFRSDFDLAARDGHNAYRFSLEWSRIEPAPDRIDPDAVRHYHDVLAALQERRLRPIVTLHHFTNPLWIADLGGWENRETIAHFLRYVRFCAREFGGEVDWWCTINEPEVLGFRGYSEGTWPPAKRDDGTALRVIAHLLEAHGLAYHVLHEHDGRDADGDGRTAVVSFAKHRVTLEPERAWSPLDVARAYFENRVFNDAVEAAAVTGDIRLSIPGAPAVHRSVRELAGSLDYVALNYYTRWKVRALGNMPHVPRRDAPLTDLGWEIYPGGFEDALVRVARLGKPVLVTENGFADATDYFRPGALIDYLLALRRAIHRGVDVIGYLHWSLLDNFEWSDGFAPRFGLYSIDPRDPDKTRVRTRSADLYSRIVRANAIDAAMVRDAHVPP
jgi:beta-glucosidase